MSSTMGNGIEYRLPPLHGGTKVRSFLVFAYPGDTSVTVAHPLLVKLITSARAKTDARDTLHLARLLAAGLIPAVWIPPQDVRELRALVAHHTRLIRQRTQAKNRLRSTLHRYNIVPPAGGLFAQAQRNWWEALAFSAVEKLRIRQDLSVLASLEPLIAEVEEELTRLSGTEPSLPSELISPVSSSTGFSLFALPPQTRYSCSLL